MDGLGAAQGVRRRLAEAEVPHLPLADQRGHGAHRLLDRRTGIDAVQAVEVDVIGPQPPQGAVDRPTHVPG
jgi:hypothetical protein